MQHTLLLHKKSLTDRQQQMQSLTAGIDKKTKLNKHLQKQIMDLAELLDDQVPAIEAMSAKQDTSRSVLHSVLRTVLLQLETSLLLWPHAPKAHFILLFCRPRARGLAASKKLRDITRAQQTEVAKLKASLHKLHLRSYPAFVDPKVAPVSDRKADAIPAMRGRPGDMLQEQS